ncbi:hypothetical protein ILUMI_06804 [Ignelater luminosus]|uniref:Methylated-DNA--protein-cysteine methyltransferase n=1 Tax=Ignelater luminosus TaxID=2038154 RepID=A0A8K0D9H9_IGNLU|nr:hypothetical protein ILUMI_06804 [Ignelater luminosus]
MQAQLNLKSVTPEEYKKMKGFEITYGFAATKFGPSIIGINNDRLCYIAFYDEGKDNSAIDNLKNDWPNAILKANNDAVQEMAKSVFDDANSKQELNVLLKGTDLQINVWKELTKLKIGTTTNYEQIAKAIGKPSAIRAVANAISRNKVAYVIPCHRVIQKSGNISKYRWGVHRKKEMLEYEKET